MLTSAQLDELRPYLRTTQVIVGALALGVLNFAAIVAILFPAQQNQQPDSPLMTYASLAIAGCAVAALLIVPPLVANVLRRSFPNSREQASVRPMAQAYQTLLIIRCALLEGAIFFCLVSYMLEGQRIVLAAAGFLFVLLIAHFPTASKMAAWIEDETLVAEQLRQLQ